MFDQYVRPDASGSRPKYAWYSRMLGLCLCQEPKATAASIALLDVMVPPPSVPDQPPFSALVGAISIVVAYTVPDVERPWTLGMPGAVYGLMWLIWPVDRWYAQRVRRELGPEVAPG